MQQTNEYELQQLRSQLAEEHEEVFKFLSEIECACFQFILLMELYALLKFSCAFKIS